MMKRLLSLRWILLPVLLACLPRHAVAAMGTITIGLHTYHNTIQSHREWQPLADYLTQSIPGTTVQILGLSHDEMEVALQNNRLDFVFTDPAIYVQLREYNSFVRAVATVRGVYHGKPVFSQGGAIVVRSDRSDISSLAQLRGKRIAIEGREHLNSYQSQAHLLYEAGIEVEREATLQLLQDAGEERLFSAVLQGEVDAAFVPAGQMEELVAEGRLPEAMFKVLAQQNFPGYPYAVSSRLYPERPLVVMSHVAPHVAQRLVTALYRIEPGSALLAPLGLYHFRLPEDYSAITELARDLRIPPFDHEVEVSVQDIWGQYRLWIVLLLLAVLGIAALAIGLLIVNRRLSQERQRVEQGRRALQQSEAQLRESLSQVRASNERLDLVIQASNDGIWDWDVDSDEVYYSPRWKSMLGYQDSELDNHFSSWERLVDPKDLQAVMERIQGCIAGGGDGFEVEFSMRHKDGHWLDILSRAKAVRNADGVVVRFAGTHVDMTARKQLERALREQEKDLSAIIDNLPSIVFLKEAEELRYVRFNRSGEEKLGVAPGFFIGKNDYDLFPPDMATGFIADDRRALNFSAPIDIAEEEIDTPRGRRIMHTRKLSLRDEEGRPKYLLGIADDITEVKAAEAEQKRLQRELQQAQKMDSLGQLTGGIAHDFNNLLAIINGYAGLAQLHCEKDGNEKMAGYMHHLTEASDRATHLVAQMLTFSRSEQAEDMPVQFAPLVKEDIKMLRATLPTSMEIKTEIESDLPDVMMNPTQLHQILMNLSVNGRDAMDGVGQLTIRLGWARGLDTESPISHKPVKGDWVELSVSDTGSGIDAETAKRIFNPFFTTKAVGKGTGMGLSVIYGIMENHHGHILLESEPGSGSCFRMLFAPHLGADGISNTDTATVAPLPQGDGSQILVVDDELSLGIFMAELLNAHGYRATPIADSAAALALFRQQPARFRMVITDQTMPRMSGTELIAAVRDIVPSLPSIICTGYSDKIDARGAAELGIAYFTKPVDEAKILLQIADLLHQGQE